jgi:hypothetical protein
VVGNRSDVCLENARLRRGGTDDVTEPSEVGRPPRGRGLCNG